MPGGRPGPPRAPPGPAALTAHALSYEALELGALVIHTYEREIHFAKPPLAVQRAIFGPLAALGRRLGYSAEVPYPVGRQAPAASASPRTA